MKVVTKEFLNNNEFNSYPIHVRATFEPIKSLENADKSLIMSLLVDMKLTVPNNLAACVYISNISSTKSLVTMTIMGSALDPFSPASEPASGEGGAFNEEYQFLGGMILARVQVRKSSSLPKTPVEVLPVQDGVGGWVVFGSGILEEGSWYFREPAESRIADECVTFYQYGGVKSLGKSGFTTSISGAVSLIGQGGIEVVPDDLGLSIQFAGSNLDVRQGLNTFKGACGGRPESDTCSYLAVKSINGIVPQGLDKEIVLVLDKPLYAVLEGANEDEVLAISSDLAQEIFCAGRLDIPDGCSTGGTPYAPFLRSAFSAPSTPSTLSPGTRMTLEVSDSAGLRSFGFAYVQQHSSRPSVAILGLESGVLHLAGEVLTHLHVDLTLGEWQLYGPAGPSLYGFGAMFNNLRGGRSFSHLGQDYSVSLGLMTTYDMQGITKVRVSISAPDQFDEEGVYAKQGYCRYVHEQRPEYALELRGAPDDNWAILKHGLVVAAGQLGDSGVGTQIQGYIRSSGESSMRTIAVLGVTNE